MARKQQLTITEQIELLEAENKRLKEQDSLIGKIIVNEFNMDRKTIHSLIKSDGLSKPSVSKFEHAIRSFYKLKNNNDLKVFSEIMLTENILNYFNSKRNPKDASSPRGIANPAEQDEA